MTKNTDPSKERPVVLVVEDDADHREMLRDALASSGFVVFEADSLVQAKRILKAHGTVIDRVITDDWVKDGLAGEAIRHVCEVLGIPCKVISGLKSPHVDFEKPFSCSDLIRAL